MKTSTADSPRIPEFGPEFRTHSGLRNTTTRYHDLDSLRAILMIWGIVVHTSTLADSLVFDTIARCSGWCRMEAFFTISGLFACMLVSKYGGRRMVYKRLISIGIPCAVTLLLLNPMTNALVYRFHNADTSVHGFLKAIQGGYAIGPVVWHLHVWFLISLLAYSIVAPKIAQFFDQSFVSKMPAALTGISDTSLFGLICFGVVVSCFAGRTVFEIAIEPFFPRFLLFLCKATLYYFPFFVLGMLLFRSNRLLTVFRKAHWMHVFVGLTGIAAAQVLFAHLPKIAAETLRLTAETYLAVALSGILFFLFGKYFSVRNRVSALLSEAAYTVYLFHFITIYTVAVVFEPMLGRTDFLLSFVAIATFVLTLLLHFFVIRRIPLLQIAFNGKISS